MIDDDGMVVAWSESSLGCYRKIADADDNGVTWQQIRTLHEAGDPLTVTVLDHPTTYRIVPRSEIEDHQP